MRDRLDETTTVELKVPPSTHTAFDDQVGDIVIDLTDQAPLSTTRRRASGRSPWGIGVTPAVLLVLAVAAGALAAANYSAALQWRAHAQAAELRAVQAEEAAAASRREAEEARRQRRVASQRRSALADQLAVSEADVVALEARLVALASDRASEQDLGGGVGGSDSDALLRSLEAQVNSCLAQVRAVRSGLTADADVGGWHRALNAAEASCAQVAADIDALAGGG